MFRAVQPFPLSAALISVLIAISTAACASDSTRNTTTIAPENSEEECYCSVRKRQQVERRLQKKKN
ncbi:MAG: hypothetical protein GY802_21530 [Gammaproteobacteria bacterium]|nr:hypothetical protein [Gammaproteobacteria bacterium]